MAKRRRRTSSSTTTSSYSSDSTTSSCFSSIEHSDAQLLFAVMLAALSNRQSRNSTSEGNQVIQKALDHLLLSLLSKSPSSFLHFQQTLHIPLISLLPVLLNSKCSEVACSGFEVVGAASLYSLEMNEQIASDEEIVKGMITALASSKRSVAMAACNAILDLLTTSVGRCRLLEFSAVDNLIFCFLQAPKSSTPSISLMMEEMSNKANFRIGFVEDEYPILLLHVVITLINECTLEQLRKVPKELSNKLLTYVSSLWAEVHKHILIDAFPEPEIFMYLSNIRTNNLAESLFRLSMEGTFTRPPYFQEVKRSIFHLDQVDFESFIMNHWEDSPLLIRKPSSPLLHDNVFSPFLQFLRSKETVSAFLTCLLQNLSCAPSISSTELDVINFIKESREHIGCPIIYQQDIRIVKTLDSKEMHFFPRPLESHDYEDPHLLYMDDILRCKEAYNDGYTFALRGMEFRFNDIAIISEGLAFLFGQPSAGVNMYLTPPNSQGLARHRDDHCVLVCQISGIKKWKIFPNPCPRLPRLYERVDSLHDLDRENLMVDECKEFLLREGDILYIPRGFPHEACTVADDDGQNGSSEFSLHLTLAIEIEPPFEWEGFVHVALRHWGQNCNFSNHTSRESSSVDLGDVAVCLMHIAIKVIADVDPIFRKACLVGAISFPSVSEAWLQTHQQATFNHLLSRINIYTSFIKISSSIESAIGEHEDLLENIRWLRHLDNDSETVDLKNQKIHSIRMEDIFHILIQQKEKLESAFMEVKSGFCRGVVFDDVARRYNVLLEKYRRTRTQYINGMLALNPI